MEMKIFSNVKFVCSFLFLKRKIVMNEMSTLITVRTSIGIFSAAVNDK